MSDHRGKKILIIIFPLAESITGMLNDYQKFIGNLIDTIQTDRFKAAAFRPAQYATQQAIDSHAACYLLLANSKAALLPPSASLQIAVDT